MHPRSFSTPAIILKRFNYGEADRILTLLTPQYGKITVIAKGVRKPQSRKRGHIELFNHIKGQIVNGKSLGILTEVETVHSFNQLTSHLRQRADDDPKGAPLGQLVTILHAYQYCELIDRLIPENQPHPEVFDLLSTTLQSLTAADLQPTTLDAFFKQKLIRLLGFWPSDRTSPPDIDLYLDQILEKPLKTPDITRALFTSPDHHQ